MIFYLPKPLKISKPFTQRKIKLKELYTDWDLKLKEIALSPLLEKRD